MLQTPTFYFVLSDNVLPLDFAGPLQVLLEAKQLGAELQIQYVGAGGQINIDGGLSICSLQGLPLSIANHDVIVLPGCHSAFTSYESEQGEKIVSWLRKVVDHHQVLTICSGAVLAAKSGLLRGRRYTSHFQLLEQMKLAFPEGTPIENRIFVDDGNIISSAGISSGIDMTLYFVAKQFGEHIAAKVAQQMLIYFRRSGQDPQLSSWLRHRNHMHRAVHQVQDLICENVGVNYTVAEMAETVHMSARQLSRIFQTNLGLTLGEYVREVKIGYAKQLLQCSACSIEQVATACGFSSSRHFRRAWNKLETITPLAYKKSV